MPYGDRTGPMGQGPMSGRGAGYCAGYGMQGYANPVSGRGFWHRTAGGCLGRPGGRGRRNWFYATGLPGWARGQGSAPFGKDSASSPSNTPGNEAMDKVAELQVLKEQANYFEEGLAGIKKRIAALESKEKSGE